MKKFLTIAFIWLTVLFLIPSAVALEDSAGLLTSSEQQLLQASFEQIEAAHQVTVEAVTVRSLGGEDALDYANDYMDDNLGTDSVLLLIAIEDREWALLADGKGYLAVNDDAQMMIEEEILPFLSEDRFYDAFARYAALCEELLVGYENGEIFEYHVPIYVWILPALGVGLLVGFITVMIMKGKLKSVRHRNDAREYTRPGSMQIMRQQDTFLYSNVTRVAKPKNNSSGGGGGGGSRGGRSGGF
ncbi:MAG: TPM domain-containing protein [Clostridia bacterium]|nr:TPM domain-containing protein [Clostridia bacterium]